MASSEWRRSSVIVPSINSPIADRVVEAVASQDGYEERDEIIVVGLDVSLPYSCDVDWTERMRLGGYFSFFGLAATMLRHFATWPAIYLTIMAWCWGASRS